MTVYVFVGPTLRQADVEISVPGAVCLPPVAQGDLYRIARLRPRAIGIIDGYFSGAPSVWHKEILWALSEGVPVFGSASMGALRAAELDAFGMRGIGRIFEAFRDGELEDDDEVAVVHGPAELGYLVLSEPMVNVRATMARAEAAAVVRPATRQALEAAAKATYFPQRTWPALLEAAADQGLAAEELAALRDWMRDNVVDQKRADALEMLTAIRDFLADPRPVQPGFRFEWTQLWDNLVAEAAEDVSPTSGGALPTTQVLDELRLLGPSEYERVKSRALLRFLADADARRRGTGTTSDAISAASTRLRANLGLFSRDQLVAWTAQNGLDERSFARLMQGDADLHAFAKAYEPFLAPFLLDELRLTGGYGRLAERARDKARRLEGTRSETAEARVALGPETLQMRVWYFEERLGQPIPDDAEAFAAALGFADAVEFDRAMRREWLYARIQGRDGAGASGGGDGTPGLEGA